MPLTTALRLLAFLGKWFAPAIVSRFFEPLVADWQHEWNTASGPLRRWLVAVRGSAALALVIVRLSPLILVAPMPRHLAGAALARTGVFCGIGTLVLLAPFVSQFRGLGLGFFVSSSLYLVPHAIGVLLPFAMILVVDVVGLDRTLTDHARRRMITQFTLIGILALVILLGWATPYAYQSWRDSVWQARGLTGYASRGVNELTIIELFRRQPMAINAIWARLFLVLLPLLLVVSRWFAVRRLMSATMSRLWIEIPWVLATTAAISWIQLCGYAFGLRLALWPWQPLTWGIILTATLVMSAVSNARAFRERSTSN